MSHSGRPTTTVILIAVALILAVLAGLAIPWASGSAPGQKVFAWTPPAPSVTPTRTPLPTHRPNLPATQTRTPTVTASVLPVTATEGPVTSTPAPILTGVPDTATPSPAPAQLQPELSPTRAAISGTPANAPVATVRQGPLSIRPRPSKDFGAIALAKVRDTFAVTGRTADGLWLRVCCVRDRQAWLAAEFVDVAGSMQDVPSIEQ